MLKTFKNLVSILATFVLVIKANKKDNIILKKVLYIKYPIKFKKNKFNVLIDCSGKINIIISAFTSK